MVRLVIGALARLLGLIALWLIVGDAVTELWRRGDEVLAVVAAIFFPITAVVWPIAETGAQVFGLTCWWLLIVLVVSFVVSRVTGSIAPLE